MFIYVVNELTFYDRMKKGAYLYDWHHYVGVILLEPVFISFNLSWPAKIVLYWFQWVTHVGIFYNLLMEVAEIVF